MSSAVAKDAPVSCTHPQRRLENILHTGDGADCCISTKHLFSLSLSRQMHFGSLSSQSVESRGTEGIFKQFITRL